MRCIVTAGPAFEPIDSVRRITNFSTGRLGTELSSFLAAQGFEAILCRSVAATFPAPVSGVPVVPFGSSAELAAALEGLGGAEVGAVFHAAAVADFAVGQIRGGEEGEVIRGAGKISTRSGAVWVELVPSLKIIERLRDWFPCARLTGWKYEVSGLRQEAVDKAAAQIRLCRTDACVANGAGYGAGYGLVRPDGSCVHAEEPGRLFALLRGLLRADGGAAASNPAGAGEGD